MRGLSLRELSDATQNRVSHNALSRYEKGIMMPGSDVLLTLARALDQKPDFFFRPFQVRLHGIRFRKTSALSAKKRQAIEQSAQDYLERYSEIEQILGLSSDVRNPLAKCSINSDADIEHCTELLRSHWKLGQAALASVVETCEANGVKVFDVDAPSEFDGLSGQADGSPVVILAKWLNEDLCRKRFTALHELGHLLLNFQKEIDARVEERFCHRFAGAMLIPAAVFKKEFGGVRTRLVLGELLDIKARYGISLAAIVQRASQLGLIDASLYRTFQVKRNSNGWRNKEPGHCEGEESSGRFEQLVLRATAEELISTSKAAALLKRPLPDVKAILAEAA
jgi:Zn-dependent peptidase ImmA (M78 family)